MMSSYVKTPFRFYMCVISGQRQNLVYHNFPDIQISFLSMEIRPYPWKVPDMSSMPDITCCPLRE